MKFVIVSLRHCIIASKDYLLCILSAVLLIFSFPNFSAVGQAAFGGNLWILAWFGFIPLFFALENKSKGKAFLLTYFTGFIFWWGIIYWLVHVTLLGTTILILYLALYFAIFGFIISRSTLPTTPYPLLFVPSLWVLLEYLRSHLFTGFGWALLGYSQYLNLPIIQIADISGAYGVSFLVMMTNVWIYRVARNGWREAVKKQKIIFPSFILLLSLTYGFYKLTRIPHPASRTPLKISVIQGNIPQELKWNPEAKDFIIDKYLKISTQAAKEAPDLIIWPEASLPVVLEEEPLYFAQVKDFARTHNMKLLLGAVTRKENLFYNSALLVSPKVAAPLRYDKLHLVPFGEYIPFRRIFGFLETIVPIGDISAGRKYSIFSLIKKTDNDQTTRQPDDQTNFSVLICFEDLFPQLSRLFVKKGADFLVNITNDAWYKETPAPYQHLVASVFRAVENRTYLVRSANTGISGFIGPDGKIISLVQDRNKRDIFIDGFRTEDIITSKRNLSFYTRFGDIFIGLCFLFVLYGLIRYFRKGLR